MTSKRHEVAHTPQRDYKAIVIRGAILVGLVTLLASGCGSERGGPPVYESRPVAVLPPESAPPPPINAVRPTDRSANPPVRETEPETQPPPAPTPRATPRVTSNEAQFPVAKPVPGKPGFVYSPFESNGTMIDVTGYSSGQKVKDPGTNKIFIVP
jgi:hypothetical protein